VWHLFAAQHVGLVMPVVDERLKLLVYEAFKLLVYEALSC
jgi:hypothetical protein